MIAILKQLGDSQEVPESVMVKTSTGNQMGLLTLSTIHTRCAVGVIYARRSYAFDAGIELV